MQFNSFFPSSPLFQHYNLDSENFQYVCLRLSCKARSLINEIRMAQQQQEMLRQHQEVREENAERKRSPLYI